MTLVAVSVGALSKPGVDTGIGSASSPLPSPFSASPVDARLPGTARFFDDARRHRVGDARAPSFGCDFLEPARPCRGSRCARLPAIRADDDGKLVLAAAAVDDVREEKRLALVLFDAADVLPAHQRMQLRVLVDRPVDREQQAAPAQLVEMLVQVGIAASGVGHARVLAECGDDSKETRTFAQ